MGSRLNEAAGRARTAEVIARASEAHELTYVGDDGKTKIIPLLALPALLTRRDVAYLRTVAMTFNRAFAKVAAARRAGDREVAAALPVEPEEEAWLAMGPAPHPGMPLIARWDMNIETDDVRGATLFEMNGCAAGGLHYAAACSEIMRGQMTHAPQVRAALPVTMRAVWLDVLARAAARPTPAIAWLEDRTWDCGITEGPSLAKRLTGEGRRAVVADPREVEWRRGKLYARGTPVDLLYRSLELRDLVELEREGASLRGMREAFARGRVASPPAGDLDHKSLLELWSSPRFAPMFSAAERAVFRRHVPWTRLIGDRRTEGPDGRMIDLPSFARRARARLVLKPNRSCGGDGVLIGRDTPAARWERAIAAAVSGRAPAVVQARVDSAQMKVHGKSQFTTYGLLAGEAGIGILGRAAPFRVVNVARGGYLMGVLLRRAG